MANIALKTNNMLVGLGISHEEVLDIINIDAAIVSTNSSRYSLQNAEQYYLACNTWIALCYDIQGSRPARFLRNMLVGKGLLRVIDACNKAANCYIQSGFSSDGGSDVYPLYNEDPQKTLQLLRYLKRFSPLGADKVRDESIETFLNVNSRIDRGEATTIDAEGRVLAREYRKHSWLLPRLREITLQILGRAPSHARVRDAAAFSNGVTADGCKTYLDKVIALGRVDSNYGSPLYPLTSLNEEPLDFVKVVAVPKSYKAWRIIAEVPAYQQYYMQGIRALAVQRAEKSRYGRLLVQDDQSINQEWSRLGSIDGSFATIDLSSASDSIGDAFAKAILPHDWYELIAKFNPTQLLVKNKLIRRHIFQTSGNGTTFIFESIIFLTIALAATEYASLFLGRKLMQPRTFGDDLIVDTSAYDTLIDFLGLLGFKVNVDKSFGDGFYRESCGTEWYLGLDMASKYWPRKEVYLPSDRKSYQRNLDLANRSLVSMISLQHKMFSFESVDAFLCEYIRNISKEIFGIPHMTASLPGTECTDLWESYPVPIRKKAPHGGALSSTDVRDLPIELTRAKHLVLRSVYPEAPVYSPALDIYRYVEFLKHGPRFESPLDELLRVSAAPTGSNVLANVAMSRFGYSWE